MNTCLAVWCSLLASGAFAGAHDLEVTADFSGGSVHVSRIQQQQRRIRIEPQRVEGEGWRCWWYFRVSGIDPGETITLEVGPVPWATPKQAFYSTDQLTWSQTAAGERSGSRLIYKQRIEASEAWFAWGPPFVPEDAQALVDWADRYDFAEAFELCKSRGGLAVPAIRIAEESEKSPSRYGIWVQARQHAWEAGSSWVCRGFLEWIVSDDPQAQALRRAALITIVPIMDVDSVHAGTGGKNQLPHDHNRDWSDHPRWRTTTAAMEQIENQVRQNQFDLFVDLHNPGAGEELPFFYIVPREFLSAKGNRNLDRFLACAREEMQGPLRFEGSTRESGASYDRDWRRISKNWVSFHSPDHVVSLTLETAWNTPHSHSAGYRNVGRNLGLAMHRYFRTQPRK